MQVQHTVLVVLGCNMILLDLGGRSDDIAHRLQKGILAEPTMQVGQKKWIPLA
jgi:hypothetical protein